jgi:hypothetical protein
MIDVCMVRIVLTRVCFPYAGIVTMCMRVILVKLSFQTVIGWVPVLEYMLSSVRRFLRPHLISLGNECLYPL